MRNDLTMWLQFVQHPSIFCRPFLDFSAVLEAKEIFMYSDASCNPLLGAGRVCQKSWFITRWDKQFIIDKQPSIEYLELFAVAVGFLNWINRFKNSRIILFCDNTSVVSMINKNTSNCPKCLTLIWLIVLESMIQNVRGLR